METEEIQARIKEVIAKLYSRDDVKFITNHTIEEDLDSLKLAACYFLLDSEAKAREAFAAGKMEGGNNVK